MGFFKKTMLGYSNPKGQPSEVPSHQCRNIPSPTTELLSEISLPGDILASQPHALASTAVRSPGIGEDDRQARYPDLDLELSESLGFESSVERIDGGDLNEESYRTVQDGSSSSSSSRSVSRTMSERILRRRSTGLSFEDQEFPPLRSFLDEYGWPRFILEGVRSDGRLVICMERNQGRRVVRSRSTGDETMTRLVVPDD